MSAPSPQQRVRKRPVIGRIPAHALGGAGDPQLLHLIRKIFHQRLADRISGRKQQVQTGLHTILFPDAVCSHSPARLIQ